MAFSLLSLRVTYVSTADQALQTKVVREMSSKKKRKQLFVDSKVQGILVRQLIIHWALACVLIFLYLFAMETFASGFEGGVRNNFWAGFRTVRDAVHDHFRDFASLHL